MDIQLPPDIQQRYAEYRSAEAANDAANAAREAAHAAYQQTQARLAEAQAAAEASRVQFETADHATAGTLERFGTAKRSMAAAIPGGIQVSFTGGQTAFVVTPDGALHELRIHHVQL